MKADEVRSILEERIKKVRDVFATKNAGYARGEDRLSNFKRLAEFQRTIDEKAWLGVASKHFISIVDLIEDLPRVAPMEVWDEKIGDAIVYLCILEMLIRERMDTP